MWNRLNKYLFRIIYLCMKQNEKRTFFERRTFIFWGCWFSFAWFNRVKKSWVFFLNIIPSIFFRKRSHGNFIPKTFFSCVGTEEKNCEKKFKNVLFVFDFFGRFFSVFMIKTERKNIFRGNSFLFPVWDKMKKNIFFMCETKGKKEKWEINEKYWEKFFFFVKTPLKSKTQDRN